MINLFHISLFSILPKSWSGRLKYVRMCRMLLNDALVLIFQLIIPVHISNECSAIYQNIYKILKWGESKFRHILSKFGSNLKMQLRHYKLCYYTISLSPWKLLYFDLYIVPTNSHLIIFNNNLWEVLVIFFNLFSSTLHMKNDILYWIINRWDIKFIHVFK